MVAELNAILGYPYFQSKYYNDTRLYELLPTEYCKQSKKFIYLATEGPITFAEMFHYLNGILMGYRIAKEIHGF